ncbi:DNA polymerase V [Erwinia rhapontici]|uniref:DNA polymerase V n=1 Tax=Erwinia rhapontici TaxID=55212 RepID=UPI001D0D8620|nr:DNA polymerase V [Erwinia rhapontici]UDQ80164.1 DNA polymerase V [Erwinia rhapontici]
MARTYEIKSAFLNSIKRDATKGQVVNTSDFVKELEKVNHHFTRREANEWIDYYQPSWREYAEEGYELKRFFLMNMGYTR